MVIDNASGEILAYVGSGGPNSTAPQVDGARALRQAGSTLKPFIYELAIEERFLTAASLLDDAPIEIDAGTGVYAPENYDHGYKGLVSLRTALGNSLNVPAVRALMLTGVEPFLIRLRALGYDSLVRDAEYYGFSVALGSAEVTLLDQVAAYRALATGGAVTELTLRPDGSNEERRVLDPAASFIIGDILSDRSARSITFGLSSDLATPFWSAVKTGTSKAMRDNWTIGFSEHYTVGVWVGNFEGDSMRGVSGMTGAAPVWREVIGWLHREQPSEASDVPTGLVRQEVAFEPALEPTRAEWFLAGTELERILLAARRDGPPKIASPLNGLVVAVDPDIPLDRQVLPITIENARDGLCLTLNGKALPPLEGDLLWTPQPGYHELALLDAEGGQIDKVVFTVRQVR